MYGVMQGLHEQQYVELPALGTKQKQGNYTMSAALDATSNLVSCCVCNFIGCVVTLGKTPRIKQEP